MYNHICNFIVMFLGVPSVSDPHEAIHGDLNEQIKIGEAVDEDKDDYEKWKKGIFICEALVVNFLLLRI